MHCRLYMVVKSWKQIECPLIRRWLNNLCTPILWVNCTAIKNSVICQSGWLLSKSLQAINAGEGVEKREPSYTVAGNAN